MTNRATEEKLAALRRAAMALKPFSDRVYNDNGDMTINMEPLTSDDCIAAYFALRAVNAALASPAPADSGAVAWIITQTRSDSDVEPGWRPIETAPKDGTTILMAKYHDGDRYWIASGCIEDQNFWCDFADDDFVPFSHQNPSHWMPLPAAPQHGSEP